MRVLVTGGAGFIGSHVVEHALQAGFDVAVLDDLSSGKRANVPASVPLFQVDLRDRAATLRALVDFRPELVSHQAAQVSVPASMKDPYLDAEINVLGGISLLDACVHAKVRHVVFASTGGAIYGEVPEPERATEDFRLEPKSPYGIHKLTFERLLAVYRERGLGTSVLRYANVYGPRQDPHGEAGVIAIFFQRAERGEALQIFARRAAGDEGCVRDYVFVRDVARANVSAMTGELRHAVMNVGSGHPTTTAELARLIVAATGRSSGLLPAPPRAGDIERSLLDVTRLRELLGQPIGLEAGLTETAAWYRANS
jgi:UDP-glucose 4-epimerase